MELLDGKNSEHRLVVDSRLRLCEWCEELSHARVRYQAHVHAAPLFSLSFHSLTFVFYF